MTVRITRQPRQVVEIELVKIHGPFAASSALTDATDVEAETFGSAKPMAVLLIPSDG